MNNYSGKPDGTLQKSVAGSTTVLIEEYLAYGLTEAEVQELDDANALFDTDIQLAYDQESARKSAVAKKDADREVVLAGITTIAAKLYANPAVTNDMLAKAGFAERPVYGGRTTPKQPTNLFVTAFSDGYVELKWNRNGTSRSSIFTLWTSSDGHTWTAVTSTSKTKIKISGFTPGVQASFQVTSSVNNQTSQPSNVETIYLGGGSNTLSIAA